MTHPAQWDRQEMFKEKLSKMGQKEMVQTMTVIAVASIVLEMVMR